MFVNQVHINKMISSPEQLQPIMSPIFEAASTGNNTLNEEESTPSKEAMTERRASLTLPFSSQPMIQILPKHRSNPQVTLSPTCRSNRSPSGRTKIRRTVVVLKRRGRYGEKSKLGSSMSLDNSASEVVASEHR